MWHWMYLLFDFFYSRFPSCSVSLCEAVRLIAGFVILGYILLIFIHHGGQAPQWATALLPAARFFFVSRMLCFPSDKEFGCINCLLVYGSNLFCLLVSRLQIELGSKLVHSWDWEAHLRQVTRSFHTAAVTVTIPVIGSPRLLLFQLILHQELLPMQSNQLI